MPHVVEEVKIRMRRRARLVTAGTALLTIVFATSSFAAPHEDTSGQGASSITRTDDKAAKTPSTTPDNPADAATDPSVEHPIPRDKKDGKLIDEKYPVLKTWLHPVVKSPEPYPTLSQRHFGAKRHFGKASRVERKECGGGHCGVDLHGPRGNPIVAVAPGVIVKVERRRSGGDGMSGRYVRIQHEDGSLTTYMHLDSVARGIDMDTKVEAGQQIGTLGSTGVDSHTPHLHFSLQLPNKDNSKKWINACHFIDPAPWLVRATVIDKPERKQRKAKPTS